MTDNVGLVAACKAATKPMHPLVILLLPTIPCPPDASPRVCSFLRGDDGMSELKPSISHPGLTLQLLSYHLRNCFDFFEE